MESLIHVVIAVAYVLAAGALAVLGPQGATRWPESAPYILPSIGDPT